MDQCPGRQGNGPRSGREGVGAEAEMSKTGVAADFRTV